MDQLLCLLARYRRACRGLLSTASWQRHKAEGASVSESPQRMPFTQCTYERVFYRVKPLRCGDCLLQPFAYPDSKEYEHSQDSEDKAIYAVLSMCQGIKGMQEEGSPTTAHPRWDKGFQKATLTDGSFAG